MTDFNRETVTWRTCSCGRQFCAVPRAIAQGKAKSCGDECSSSDPRLAVKRFEQSGKK